MALNAFCFTKPASSLNVSSSDVGLLEVQPSDQELRNLKITFRTIMEIISAIGVLGNIMNLVTLRSSSLQTVPFVFIRALAVFDLISLAAIFVHFLLETVPLDYMPVVYYSVWVEDVLINSFLVAGLYCAVLLTLERYTLIRKPFKKYRLSVENTVRIKIWVAMLVSIILHAPMALQNTAKENPTTGKLVKGNNHRFLCREPYWTLFNYYKMTRELFRFFCVILLISMNAVIARQLQIAKKKHRLLVKRASYTRNASAGDINDSQKDDSGGNRERQTQTSLFKSFTEKKLTGLMASICIIYAIGNLPQMAVMVFQNEALNSAYNFQVFRQIANTFEVLNHCVNFFMFCVASSDYCRAAGNAWRSVISVILMPLRLLGVPTGRIPQISTIVQKRPSYDVERRLTPRSKDNKMVEYDELMNCITTTTMAAQCGETSSMGSTRARSVSPNELQKINRSENRLSITNSPRPQDLGSGKYRRTSLTRDERQTTNSTEDEQL